MKIKSLKLDVTFDFEKCECKVTDVERGICDKYKCLKPFGGVYSDVGQINDFNHFVGGCVHAFLDDNNYDTSEDIED